MRKIRHWTPNYLWARTQSWLYQRLNPELPWLTAAACKFLDQWVKGTDQVVEFGSGRSTTWFAQRAADIYSVEHDAQWFERVDTALCNLGVRDKVQLLLRMTADGYIQAAEEMPIADVCLVDGVHRAEVAKIVTTKLRSPGGLLVLDNANWYLPPRSEFTVNRGRTVIDSPTDPMWIAFSDEVADWRCYWTSNGVTDTAFYFKP